MIKRVTIKDYMAHKETELELDPGVTVLTGPNNSGKSAVVEALRSVGQNPSPHHAIRHGASQAVVRVELESGEAVEWVRSKGNTVYRVYPAGRDGEEAGDVPEVYAKFGRMPPEDIRNLLRLDLVETESGAVDIHIGNQRYPIFLLDQTGSQAASFFAASTEAEYLLRMQQALKTKTDRARSKRKELLQECADLEKGLALYLPLTALDRDLSATEALHARLEALQQALPRLLQRLQVLEEIGRQYARKAHSSALLKELAPPPEIQETKGLELILQNLQNALSQSGVAAARAATLTSLSGPPLLGDTSRLDALIKAGESDATSLNARRLAGETLAGLDPPPVLHEVKQFEEMVRNLRRTQITRNQSIAAGRVLESMTAPPDPPLVAPLQTLIGQLSAVATSFVLCSTRGGALEALPDPPDLLPIRPLEELTVSLRDVQRRMQGTHQLGGILSHLTSSPEPQAGAAGDALLQRLIVLHDKLEANARLQGDLASAITAQRQEIEQVIEELGLCPLCGNTLDMDHFLETTHG